MGNGVTALEGIIGYGIGNARIEVEVGHERFESKSRKDRKNKKKIEESETVYLLAKELAYDVKNNRTPKLARGLEKVPGIDIVSFASALRKVDPHIDSLICNARTSDLNDRLGFCMRPGERHFFNVKNLRSGIDDSVNRMMKKLWMAIEETIEENRGGIVAGERGFVDVDIERSRGKNREELLRWERRSRERSKENLWRKVLTAAATETCDKDGVCVREGVDDDITPGVFDMLPGMTVSSGTEGLSKLYHNGSTAGYWPKSGYYKAKNNAATVAHNIVNSLSSAEKDALAELLVQRVEGGEVVEIKAISSTSVMINVCYDLAKGISIVPYACLGLGGNLVGVVDGFVTPKLAYKLKAGFSYQITPEISAFFGGYYHKIIGDGAYEDLPVKRLSDDLSPAGRTKDTAIANFSMAYAGGELGVRLIGFL